MSTELPLPAEMSRWSSLPDLCYRGKNQWTSSCPQCGGGRGGSRTTMSDRFVMRGTDDRGARGWCRQCGYFAWADEGAKIDPAKIAEAQVLRQEYAVREMVRLREHIAKLQKEEYWRGYHDAMREGQRALWRQAGIPDDFQDRWQLGYVPRYSDEIPSPALTIPYFSPGWAAVNVQYRLTNPPKPNDKYRFSYGLKPGLWLSDPDEEPTGRCLVVEGMKKAAVVYIQLVVNAGYDIKVVAVPSKTPSESTLKELDKCDTIYLALDPDAYQKTSGKESAAQRVAAALGPKRVRLVRLPGKPDDLFTECKFSPLAFTRYLSQARYAA